MWYVALTLALQIYFGIHAVKTGRPFVWVLVIIIFPQLGVAGYVIIEILPEWWASRHGHQVKTAIGKKLDPEKDLKAAQQAHEMLDSVQNRINLAEQYLKLNRCREARELYARCLNGIHREDPQILMGMAKAEFGLNNPSAVIEYLDKLKAANPSYKSPDGHLLYARALEAAGRLEEAVHEYQTLNSYYSTPEPACRLAKLYQTQGKVELAKEIFQSVVKRSLSAGQLFNDANQEWIKLAKREAGGN